MGTYTPVLHPDTLSPSAVNSITLPCASRRRCRGSPGRPLRPDTSPHLTPPHRTAPHPAAAPEPPPSTRPRREKGGGRGSGCGRLHSAQPSPAPIPAAAAGPPRHSAPLRAWLSPALRRGRAARGAEAWAEGRRSSRRRREGKKEREREGDLPHCPRRELGRAAAAAVRRLGRPLARRGGAAAGGKGRLRCAPRSPPSASPMPPGRRRRRARS